MRTPLMAGNWKMHKTVEQAIALARQLMTSLGDLDDREVAVCPPFTALHPLGEMLKHHPIKLGAQDLYPREEGAYTGEISPLMLVEAKCQYVIVGHSERRQYFGEGDPFINEKVQAALEYGLQPILCVGETRAQREAGQAEEVTTRQVKGCLEEVPATDMERVVIAYEPVWAIGTGLTATPDDAQAMHAVIRSLLAELYGQEVAAGVRILYGGSVKPDNVDALMAQPDIDGALVGGASLTAESFIRIARFQPYLSRNA
ncbi:MAG: triose-phosphate isomerase [Anaerolineae bacterium]